MGFALLISKSCGQFESRGSALCDKQTKTAHKTIFFVENFL